MSWKNLCNLSVSLHFTNLMKGAKVTSCLWSFSLMLSAITVLSCVQPSATDDQSTQIHQLYKCWGSLTSHLLLYGSRLFILNWNTSICLMEQFLHDSFKEKKTWLNHILLHNMECLGQIHSHSNQAVYEKHTKIQDGSINQSSNRDDYCCKNAMLC